MANYLLLRNNKESGPYSLDGLMELGLKPYDLVWIQGKSAAWRYPSEVEELKAIAPVVEEQPFDRFFKKPEVLQHAAIEQPAPILKTEQPQTQAEIPAIKPEYEKYIPKKSVAVTLPGQQTVARQPVREQVQEPVKQIIKETTPVKETIPVTPVQPTISVVENPVAAQVKYSQPLDEIKEMYVKTLQTRKQKIARKSFWIQNLKKVAALLSLVAVGLIAGFVIKSNGSKEKAAQQQTVSPSQPVKPELTTVVPEITKTDTAIASIENAEPLRQPTGGYVNKNPAQQENEVKPDRPVDPPANTNPTNNTVIKKETANAIEEKKPVMSFVPQNAETDQNTGERNRKVRNKNSEVSLESNSLVTEKTRDKAAEKKSSSNNSLSRLVSVSSNEYKRVAFGGIRDLQLTVTNDSRYVLDNVVVELQYIKPNELPLKTENVEFTSVGPNATSTIRVPDTNRGIKVVFRIVNIKSRQMDEVVSGN